MAQSAREQAPKGKANGRNREANPASRNIDGDLVPQFCFFKGQCQPARLILAFGGPLLAARIPLLGRSLIK